MYQIITVYTLTIYNFVYQLCLNKAVGLGGTQTSIESNLSLVMAAISLPLIERGVYSHSFYFVPPFLKGL